MITVLKHPGSPILLKTPAWFQVKNTGVQKKVIATITCDGDEIGKAYSYASNNDIAKFELSDFFIPYVKPVYTGPGSPIKEINSDVLKKFTITFECTNDPSSSATRNHWVLYGSLTPDLLAKINYGSSPYFNPSGLIMLNPFLSLKPETTIIRYKTQPEYINWLSIIDYGSVDVTLVISYPKTGMDTIVSLGSFNATPFQMYQIDATFENTVVPHIPPMNTAIRYKIIFSAGNNGAPKEYVYNLNLSPKIKGSFLFVNSLGGRDTFCPTGTLEISSGVSNSLTKIITAPHPKQNQYAITDYNHEYVFTQNSGFISYEQSLWLSQLLYSQNVFWVNTENSHMPVTITSCKINTADKRAQLYNAEIKFIFNPNFQAE